MSTGRRRCPTRLEVHAYRDTFAQVDLSDVPGALLRLGATVTDPYGPTPLDRSA